MENKKTTHFLVVRIEKGGGTEIALMCIVDGGEENDSHPRDKIDRGIIEE